MDGIRLNDLESLEAYGVDKQKIVEEITRAYAHQIYIDGFFNGDPHPGKMSISISIWLCLCIHEHESLMFPISMYYIFQFIVEIL